MGRRPLETAGVLLPLVGLVVPVWAMPTGAEGHEPALRLAFAITAVPGTLLGIVLLGTRAAGRRRTALTTAVVWGLAWLVGTVVVALTHTVEWGGIDAGGAFVDGVVSALPTWGSLFVLAGVAALVAAAVVADRTPPGTTGR